MSDKAYAVLDRPEVTSVLFYPRRDVGLPRLAEGTHTVRVPVAPGLAVGGKVYVATPGAPMILFFHGNGEIASDYDTIAPFYTRLGITLFVCDYRGYGLSDGTASASALIADAAECFARAREVLAERQVEVGPVYVMGRSLGSAAALEVVHRHPGEVAGLILESGFAYTFPLIERIGFLQLADAYEHKDGFGNLDKIAEADVPTLIIHGDRDLIIPVGDAEALFESSPAKQKTLLRIPGAGHNDLMLVGRETYFAAIGRFCGTVAEGAAPATIDTPVAGA